MEKAPKPCIHDCVLEEEPRGHKAQEMDGDRRGVAEGWRDGGWGVGRECNVRYAQPPRASQLLHLSCRAAQLAERRIRRRLLLTPVPLPVRNGILPLLPPPSLSSSLSLLVSLSVPVSLFVCLSVCLPVCLSLYSSAA